MKPKMQHFLHPDDSERRYEAQMAPEKPPRALTGVENENICVHTQGTTSRRLCNRLPIQNTAMATAAVNTSAHTRRYKQGAPLDLLWDQRRGSRADDSIRTGVRERCVCTFTMIPVE